MSDVLLLTGVELEARRLARELELTRAPGFPFPVHERPGRRGLRLAPVGLRAALLPERWPRLAADLVTPLVVSAGTCGGLAPDLRVGDLILPEAVMGPGGERWNVTSAAHQLAASRAPLGWTGLLLTAAGPVATPEAKAERQRATGALAVDLESAVILAWASRQGCPSLVVRGVADAASEPLPPELVALVAPDGRLRVRRAMALALRRPATIRQALHLRRGTGRALAAVARALAAVAA